MADYAAAGGTGRVSQRELDGVQRGAGACGVYRFTNGVISTTPSSGSAALTTNKALFLPEPRVGFAWNVFGNRPDER